MKTLYKKLLFLILLFSNLLIADGVNTNITVTDAAGVNESSGSLSFTIQLSNAPWFNSVTVNYNTKNGSAVSGSDYTATSGSVTFSAWQTSKTITVPVINNSTYEATESLYLKISNSSSGYTVTDNTGRGLIYDDDIQPLKLKSFNDKSITESDIDQTLSLVASFNKTLTAPVTVNYHTVNNTALSGSDYTAISSGSITVPSGDNRAIIPIVIKGDISPEITKDFKVIIDSISRGTLIDSQATAIIYDDDKIQVSLSVTDTLEGNIADSNQMPFKIFLTKPYPLGTPLTINYTSQDGFAPSAIAGSDYVTKSGSVTFNTGEIEKLVYVNVTGDNDVEADENLGMTISGSSYIITSSIVGEILNDDGTFPGLTFTPTSGTTNFEIVEGNTTQSNLNFIMTLDAPAVAGTSFEYYTQNNTATTSNNDYTSIPVTTYNVPVGATSITLPVVIHGDTNIEGDEYFYFRIQNEVKLNIVGHVATGKIINDDGTYPLLTFDTTTYSAIEGNTSTKEVNVTLSLNAAAGAGASFQYMTADSTATISNLDYVAIPLTTYNIPLGATKITLPVTINGDTHIESDEIFQLRILNETNITISSSTISASIEILTDDMTIPAPTITTIGEFRFDDCGAGEWKKDHSSIGNDATGSPTVIQNDGKSYMCSALNGFGGSANIAHNPAYEVNEGTMSIMLYDHHNVWSSAWLVSKGNFKIEVKRVANDPNRGTVNVKVGSNTIITNDVYFTNGGGGDFDTQWILVTVTFGTNGLKLYIDGQLKGTHSYTDGLASNTANIDMTNLSGFYDEFYMFSGQMNDAQVQNLYSNILNDKNIDGTARDCGCGTSSNDPFTCDSSMYISSSTNRETLATGKMWLHKIDTTQNPFAFNVLDDTGATELYNATAYNPDDNYIYGLYNRELIKLSKTAQVTNLGTITGLDTIFDTRQLFAGAISGGFYYVSGPGVDYNKIFKIDLASKAVTTITLNQAISIQDFSFYKDSDPLNDGKFLYGVVDGGSLVKIEVATGTVTAIGSNHTGYQFDSSFSDNNGRFFANDSNGNGFFEFDIVTGIKSFVSNSQPATFNDGANCVNAALVFNDYGDAPNSYGTPRHNIANGIFMGDEVDHDIVAYTGIDAIGDDSNGIDDEDGVTLVDGSDINGSFFEPGTVQKLKIKVSKAGYLNAWVDYNLDGDFNDAGEKIFSAKALTLGINQLSFTIPSGLTTNQTSYIRFRYSSTASLTATQNASDGEVEDYAVFFGTDALRGVFNIERTNSNSFLPINSDERNAWYTQIVGRDFDYSIVFYDEALTTLQEVDNVSVKLELVNMDTNISLYQRSAHITNTPPISRLNITIPANDLSQLPATKNARFRVTYGVDASGNIIQADCLTTPSLCPLTRTDYALDNFAIRPLDFYVSIADGNTIRKENTNTLYNPLRVAAGYDYNLSVIATKYPSTDHNASIGYDATFDANLKFTSTGACADDSNGTINTNFFDGQFNDLNFTNANVGNYLLQLKDTTWTRVDADMSQCLVHQSSISVNPNLPSGCDIEAISDVNLSFYPYRFDVDFAMNNLPNSGHDDFLYMSDVIITDNDVSLQLLGSITAQNEKNETTTNFTNTCAAQEVILMPQVTTLTDDGLLPIKTALHPTRAQVDVNIARMIRFNDQALDASIFDNISDIASPINITPNRFLNENNGSMDLELRYNIQKHLSLPINPVQMTFQNLFVDSVRSASSTEGLISPNYVPSGLQDLNNTIRNFYFAQVSPDSLRYPKIYFSNTNHDITTPLNVDIYCKLSIAYCTQTNVRMHTNTSSLSKVQNGWYISTEHNTNTDGLIQRLTPNRPAVVTVNPNINVSFIDGRNNLVTTTFNNCNGSSDNVIVDIAPDNALLYSKDPANNGHPRYTVTCTDKDSSKLSGVGETGNIINTQLNDRKTSKIDW